MKTKTKILALCLIALFQSVPAGAVSEPIKMIQYSIRTTEKNLEVVQNTISLATNVYNTVLQGTIGAIQAKIDELKSLADLKTYTALVPAGIQSIMSNAKNALPNIRGYVEKQLKAIDIDPSDLLAQRDALIDTAKQLNLSSLEAISLGKKTAADLNDAAKQNEGMINKAISAATQQQKEIRDAAFGIKAMGEDVLLNQLRLREIETTAQRYMSDVRKSGITLKRKAQEEAGNLLQKAKDGAESLLKANGEAGQ